MLPPEGTRGILWYRRVFITTDRLMPAPAHDAPAHAFQAPRPWWMRRTALIGFFILIMLPFLYPAIPPLTDLPGHMGQYRVEADHALSPALQQYYALHWHLNGNLGADLILLPLGQLLGLEPATRILIMLVPVLTLLGFFNLARTVHGTVPPATLFAMPLVFNTPFLFGFVNYSLSMALMLNAFALWLRLGQSNHMALRAGLFVILSPLLWLCHVYGWLVLGLCATCAECARLSDWRWPSLTRMLLRLLPLAPPFVIMAFWRGDGGSEHWNYNWSDKLVWIAKLVCDRWMFFDIASAVFLVGMLIFLLRSRLMRPDPRLGYPAIAMLALYCVVPSAFGGGSYADMRMTPYIIALGFLSFRPRPVAVSGSAASRLRFLPVLAVGFFALRCLGTTASFALSATVYNQALHAVAHIPQGQRVAAFVGRGCRTGWNPHRLDHLPSLALLRRDAFVNDQWNIGRTQVVQPIYFASTDPGFHYGQDPSQIVMAQPCGPAWSLDRSLAELPRERFDFVWLITPPAFNPHGLDGMTEVWREGAQALYRIPHDTSLPAR